MITRQRQRTKARYRCNRCKVVTRRPHGARRSRSRFSRHETNNILTTRTRLARIDERGKGKSVASAYGSARIADVPALRQDVYLIADDLTGALDTAAQFVPLVGEIDVFWHAVERDGSIALDLGVREATEAEADRQGRRRARRSRRRRVEVPQARQPFSWSRCSAGRHLVVGWAALSIASSRRPFPLQGRVTRSGRQHVLADRGWEPVACDLGAALSNAAWPSPIVVPGTKLRAAISLWDAETDEDLRSIAAAARRSADRRFGAAAAGSPGRSLCGARRGSWQPAVRPVLGPLRQRSQGVRGRSSRLAVPRR